MFVSKQISKYCFRNIWFQRNIATNCSNHNREIVLSSNDVRQAFIDYFTVQHRHQYYRSSPVKPNETDQSLLFVNAGMNQFKPIFLDHLDQKQFEHLKQLKRVVNSQKCIRVGGKHCDLDTVGVDFTHHTFFEMLGNWSFNDYFKNEACEMAWNLLTNVFHIDSSRLFVTIFSGNDQLGLTTDLETYEIWRSIGVPLDRIVPLGMKDNFWEMGETGPCGICTEIHYLLNKPSDCSNLDRNFLLQNSIEIWNIVFIQYFRDELGQLTRLDKNFIDTGMGLERILSLVQNVPNNYATDLFTVYFDQLQKFCKWPEYSHQLNDEKDIAYRIVADHIRMSCVAIADQIKPDDRGSGYLLRRVIRRALDSIRVLSSQTNSTQSEADILLLLANTTIDKLGLAFPELSQCSSEIFSTLKEESYLYSSAILRNSSINKMAKSLNIELNEQYVHNELVIKNKINQIKISLKLLNDKLQIEQNIDQSTLNKCREEYQLLNQLINEDQTLSQRSGLSNQTIIEQLNQLELYLIEVENNFNFAFKTIIDKLQMESIHQATDYTVLCIKENCVKYKNIEDILLKLSLDLYGERPLVVLIETNEQNILIQLTVPNRYQNILKANEWFETMRQQLSLFTDVDNAVLFETIPTKRKHKIAKYRCLIQQSNSNMFDVVKKQIEEGFLLIGKQFAQI